MNIVLKTIVFLIPSLGILGGLSLAPVISLFLLLFLLATRPYLITQENIENHKLHLPRLAGYLLLAWCGTSIMWSTHQEGSLILLCKTAILFMLCSSICCSEINQEGIAKLRGVIALPLLYGIILAIIVFAAENLTQGAIIHKFRSIFQPDKSTEFATSMLDRGCAFLALASWCVIGWLSQNNKKSIAAVIFCLSLALLYMSDSLSSLVSFIAGGVAFGMVYFSRKLIWLVMIGTLALAAIMPVESYRMDPHEAAQEFQELPLSAKHRLFIWHFVAEKISHNKIYGLGFNSSKDAATENDVVNLEGENLHLLPLHPHNNILQILLEIGLIGLTLYLILALSILAKIYYNSKNPAAPVACFVTYFSIGMISFGVWQTWWIASGLFAFLMMNILLDKK